MDTTQHNSRNLGGAGPILGFDPATHVAGYCVLDDSGDLPRVLELGTLQARKQQDPWERIADIALGAASVVEQHNPAAIGIECAYVGAQAKAALMLGDARGAIAAAGLIRGVPVTDVWAVQARAWLKLPKWPKTKSEKERTRRKGVGRDAALLKLHPDQREAYREAPLDATDAMIVALYLAQKLRDARATNQINAMLEAKTSGR